MRVESIRESLAQFRARPFDRAASRVAYEMTSYVPYSMTGRIVMMLFETRPIEDFIVATSIVTGTYIFTNRLRSRIVNEALHHGFRLKPIQDDTDDRPPFSKNDTI